MQTFTAPKPGARLDVFVHEELKISRNFAARLGEQGKVLVNDRKQKPSYKVRTGDIVAVDFDPSELVVTEKLDLPIMYEDDDVVVINKPEGVLSHSKGAFNPEATVATFMEPYLQDLDGERGGIVHRLDRATSGVMICAKNEAAMSWLQKQFADRKVQKKYVAIIEGTLDPSEAKIDMAIARNPRNPKTFRVDPNGKPAQTHYKIAKHDKEHSLVELQPATGRTHQLRVHLGHQGHPIVGDIFYGGEEYERLMLHAHKLEIILPNKTRKEFVAEIPKPFHTIFHD